MADDKIIIEFDGDINALKAKLQDGKKETDKFTKSSGDLGRVLKDAAKVAAVGFGSLTAALGLAVKEAAKFETITTQFQTLTGSAQLATKVVKDLQEFTARTPFQFESVSKAGQQLLAFGFSVDQMNEKLQQIGDVSSASGKDISELSQIYGQIAAQGKLTGERLNQLLEAAVPIGPALAKTLGIAESSVRTFVSEGRVGFKEFEQAFASLSKEGGFAFEGMIKQSTTLSGLMSTVGDNVSLLASDVGQQLLPTMKEMATQFLGFVDSLRKSNTFISLVKDTISVSASAVLGLSEGFEILGKRIGAIMATVSEAVSAALNLNFKQATEIFKQNDKDFRDEVLKIEQEYAQKRQAIDNSLYAERSAAQAAADAVELEKVKALNDKKQELKQAEIAAANEEYQAKLDKLKEDYAILTEEELALLQSKADQIAAQDETEKAKDLERQGKHNDALKALDDLRLKNEIKANKERLANEQAWAQAKVNILQATANLASVIGKEGSKEVFLISKAAALAQAIVATNLAAAQALAVPPAPNVALASAAKVAGGINIAAIAASAIKGFADGGMYTGGIPGVDSLPALLQQGELVVPKKNFEEVVNAVAQNREGTSTGGTMEVIVGFTDNAFEIIEQKIVERREFGVGIL